MRIEAPFAMSESSLAKKISGFKSVSLLLAPYIVRNSDLNPKFQLIWAKNPRLPVFLAQIKPSRYQ
jgi:hypothetical protein